MTNFSDIEKSTFSGQPFQLYEFVRNSGGTDFFWRYNSTDRDLIYAGNVFTATPIYDGGIKLSGEAASTEFQVTLPATSDFASAYRLSGTVPSDTVYLRVRRSHGPFIVDLGEAYPVVIEARLVWIGTVDGITQTDDIKTVITCAMLSASFRRNGLRYGYQRNCPHVLYASNTCKVVKTDFDVVGTLTAVDGLQISATEFDTMPDGWFDGGFIEYLLASGMTERRMILSHSGADLNLLGFPAELAIGSTVTAFAGCDRTVTTCLTKFNNLANHGGFPHTPGRSPYDGMPVF